MTAGVKVGLAVDGWPATTFSNILLEACQALLSRVRLPAPRDGVTTPPAKQ